MCGRGVGSLADQRVALRQLNFDFVRDFAPVAGIMRVPNVMEVHPLVPAKTVIISDKSCDYHGAANSLRPRAVRGRPPGGYSTKPLLGPRCFRGPAEPRRHKRGAY